MRFVLAGPGAIVVMHGAARDTSALVPWSEFPLYAKIMMPLAFVLFLAALANAARDRR